MVGAYKRKPGSYGDYRPKREFEPNNRLTDNLIILIWYVKIGYRSQRGRRRGRQSRQVISSQRRYYENNKLSCLRWKNQNFLRS